MAANGNQRVKMYAPSTWSSGSSYSHLDYNTFNGTSNQLMVFAVSAGESVHDPGAVTKGLLEDLGWTAGTTSNIYVDPFDSCGGKTPCYSMIQAAINAASSGSVIKIMAGTYPENLDLNSSNNYTLQGGWNSTYTSRTSTSSVSSMTFGSNSGTVTVEYIDVQ